MSTMINLQPTQPSRLATAKDIVWLFWPLCLALALILLIILVVIASSHSAPLHPVSGTTHTFTTQEL